MEGQSRGCVVRLLLGFGFAINSQIARRVDHSPFNDQQYWQISIDGAKFENQLRSMGAEQSACYWIDLVFSRSFLAEH